MEVICFFRASTTCPFPFAAALTVAVEAGGGGWLECFVLVENGHPFLGFRRRPLGPGATEGAIVEQMRVEAGRIHEKMVRAAGLDALSRAPDGPPLVLSDDAEECLRSIRDRGIFTAHLKWIAQKSASQGLRVQIARGVENGGAPCA
ncbi:MAG: hypothetical protein AB7E29_07850 [Xanthobacter sp.]